MKWLNDYRTRLVLAGVVAAMVLGGGSAKADFTFGEPVNLGPIVNSSGDAAGVSVSHDGLSLYFCSDRDGGYGSYDIWVTMRETQLSDWEAPVNLGPIVNTAAGCMAPCISADGLTLYFSDGEYDPLIPGGIGSTDLWFITRPNLDADWSSPINVGLPINYTGGDICPSISTNGLSLYHASGQARGGSGLYDLWIATRPTTDDEWNPPTNLGHTVNTGKADISPCISADGLVLLFSSGTWANSYDLFMSRRNSIEDDWAQAVILGPEVNTTNTDDYFPCLTSNGRTMYFCSNRDGGFGDNDIWQVSIDPVGDLNSDGIVDAADMVIMVDNWGTDNSVCDIGPMPWGDGVVDVEDLIVLAEHLFEKLPGRPIEP